MSGLALFSSLRGYRAAGSGATRSPGMTVWAVLVPESLAYASLAGVSPVVGLYAVPAALILYAAFGSSKPSRRRADVGDRRAVGRSGRRDRQSQGGTDARR